MRALHQCEAELPYDGYGAAIDSCSEQENGELWCGNGEYDSQVAFCPFCGFKARVAPGPREAFPHGYVTGVNLYRAETVIEQVKCYFGDGVIYSFNDDGDFEFKGQFNGIIVATAKKETRAADSAWSGDSLERWLVKFLPA